MSWRLSGGLARQPTGDSTIRRSSPVGSGTALVEQAARTGRWGDHYDHPQSPLFRYVRNSRHRQGKGMIVPLRFNPPPTWPPVPQGWTPPAGWQPDPAWGPVPDGWQLWVEQNDQPVPGQAAPTATTTKIPIFGARAKARQLAADVRRLTEEAASLRLDVVWLKAALERLGALTVAELEQRRDQLENGIAQQTAALQQQRVEHAAQLERQAAEIAERSRTEVAAAEARKLELEGQLRLEIAYRNVISVLTGLHFDTISALHDGAQARPEG